MELRHLRYFEALASTLNFTRAAEQLHIAQPPLSRQIQQLEEELGVMLIDRSVRPLALTRAGAFFYEQSTQVLGRIEEVIQATRRLGAGQRRWLGIGFVPSMLYGSLPNTIRGFMDEHPDIDVVLSELTSVQQAQALQAGRIDVGFGRVAIDAEGLLHALIEEEPLIAVLPVDSVLADAPSVSLQALAQQQVILYPSQPRPSFADQVAAQFRVRGCPIVRTFETNGLQTAIGLVAAGIGVSLVPRSVQRLRRDDVTYRPISDLGVSSPILMSTRASDISPDLKTLCQTVRDSFSGAARAV
ncbi:DNA-binding transcriptional LysR family regulator [Sphaerotilus hippei]|uniref:DNA-binding transcriptional LysR family regulator n=1 Tax=Sphaerotilus hippei TaxID=744406 RepID=A0A318H328_9BURK|nr:LysR family transcriptional regulator [Sphaerotilus hippei]PXW97627.1 DNA-binding transcriptional LysR family regulator [Sphaerotilus hippei]